MRGQKAFLRVRNWYGKFERPISSLSLVGGFVFDALTLRRVDLFWDNLWVVGHLLIVAVCIILVHRIENVEHAEANPAKLHFWFVNILQFFFGGLLSTFLVFYFRSGTIFVNWPFLVVLAGAFLANESLKRSYTRLIFQIALFFLSLFSFTIYLVPILFHEINRATFFISDLMSAGFLAIFLINLNYYAEETLEK